MKKMTTHSFNKIIPLLVLLIWVSFIGFFIWQRANQSERPPSYDAMDYFGKAKRFWENVYNGFPENPLNLELAIRPPGTVLLSYPFGFKEDYRGFLFRSVFVPFLIWVFSILILFWPTGKEKIQTSYRTVLNYIFLLGPLPFFFQLDYGKTAYWGLVDSFLASVSALSLVLTIKSIETKSMQRLGVAVLMATICPFIKPAGCFLFLLIAIFWSSVSLLSIFDKNNQDKKASITYWWLGSILYLIIGIAILYLVLSSAYLGKESLAYFSQTQSVLNKESEGAIHTATFFSLCYDVVGPQFILFFAVFIFSLLRYSKKSDCAIPPWVSLVSGFYFISIGLWFWLWMTGISQVRYFFPFLLLGFIPLMYYSRQATSRRKISMTLWGKRIIQLVCMLPAINILVLLSQINPNQKWQDISGVDLNIIIQDEGVRMAKKFLNEIKNNTSPVMVYASYTEENTSFYNYGYYTKLIHPEVQGFNCIVPFDWRYAHVHRIHEIIFKSDYIIFHSTEGNPQTTRVKNANDSFPATLEKERIVIETFLNSLTPGHGLKTILEEKNCTISKITDRLKLKQAFEPFLLTRQWRPVFYQENHITSKGWHLFKIPYNEVPGEYIYTKDSSNSGQGYIDEINGVLPSPDTTKANFAVTLSGWLAIDPAQGIKADEIFIAVTYPDGQIRYWPTEQLSRPDLSKAFHQPALTDAGFTSTIDVSKQTGVYSVMLAFGYKGKFIHYTTMKRTIIHEPE